MDREEILAGIQISGSGAQITWYGGSLDQPQTLSLPGENRSGMQKVPPDVQNQILGPGRDPGHSAGEGKLSPAAGFLKGLLDMVPGTRNHGEQKIRVCVTVPELDEQKGRNLTEALSELGIPRRQIYLQDFRTSFFYYVVNKRKELWNGDVAFLAVINDRMTGWILHIDRTAVPCTATFQEEASSDISDKARAGRSKEDWDQERDRLLYELLGKLFERRNVTASYLYGNYFDASWAKRSFQYLTFHRHAFQGQNLFSKGACYGAMARAGKVRMPDITFLGVDMVREDIGITVRVKGRQQYLPLIREGVNWYEAHGECEVIPESEKCITILAGSPKEGHQVGHVIRLDHFPKRPDRASRLRVTVWFSAQNVLETEVEDLGFGSMYPSSGRTWNRSIRL